LSDALTTTSLRKLTWETRNILWTFTYVDTASYWTETAWEDLLMVFGGMPSCDTVPKNWSTKVLPLGFMSLSKLFCI
jgi:hypothetical protein